jgi:hypothetical protein
MTRPSAEFQRSSHEQPIPSSSSGGSSGISRTHDALFTAHSADVPAPEQSNFNKQAIRSAKDVFAGTCGGITVTLLGHPFDTVKVLAPDPSHRKTTNLSKASSHSTKQHFAFPSCALRALS